MTTIPFSDRLKKVSTSGELSVSNLSIWFERTRPTVNTWFGGREPRGPRGVRAYHRLALLEKAIRDRMGFPIPAQLNDADRAKYVTERLNALRKHETRPDGVATPVRAVPKSTRKRAADRTVRKGSSAKRKKLGRKARAGARAKSTRSRAVVSTRRKSTAKTTGDRHRPNGRKIRRSQPKLELQHQHTPDVSQQAEEAAS